VISYSKRLFPRSSLLRGQLSDDAVKEKARDSIRRLSIVGENFSFA
jgi:hypothetical protein